MASAAIANYQAPGYSAIAKTTAAAAVGQHTNNDDEGGFGSPLHDVGDDVFPAANTADTSSAFTDTSIDLTADTPNPNPADISASLIAKCDRAYFRRLQIDARTVRVAYGGKDGRLDVAIGAGSPQYEVLVRTPTMTCKWRPQVWPLGDNKDDNPQSKYGAESHELYKARYNLVVSPHATDDASMDAHGRNTHAVHFFNWCHRLTQLVHKRICDDMPQVVTFAGSKMRDAYNAIAKQRRDPFKTQEEAEAMFRENGFASPFKSVLDKDTGTYRENSEYMAFSGNVFQKISDKMKARYESEVPPMPVLHPTNPYPPALYIHSMFNQRREIEKTPGPQMGKYKEGFIFKDVPLLLLRGPNGRPYLVPFEQRKGLLTSRSIVSCLVGISFSISSKTGLLMMNTALKRVTYCGENDKIADDGGSLEDELTWNTQSLPSLTIPPGLSCISEPTVTDVTAPPLLQIAAGVKRARGDDAPEEDDGELSETEKNQRQRAQ